MKALQAFAVFASAIVLFFLILFVFDGIACNSRAYVRNRYTREECNAVLPAGYELMQGEDGYVIRTSANPNFEQFLTVTRFGEVWETYYTVKPPAVFEDSCRAKGFALTYIEQQKPPYKAINN